MGDRRTEPPIRLTVLMPASGQRVQQATSAVGRSVAYATTGSGPPLLVIPGWLSHLEHDWSMPAERRFLDALSSGRTLVRYDRPGCGLSGAYDGPRTADVELDAIAAVVDDLGAPRCDVFGWSLGAPLAVLWAAARPQAVARLVLYGGWASGEQLGDAASRSHLLGLVAEHWGLGSDILTQLFAPDADADTRRRMAQYQRDTSSARTAMGLLSLAYALDVRTALPHVRSTTLVLRRRDDRVAPVGQSRVLAAGIPHADFAELEGRSHLPSMGDWLGLVDAIRAFLGMPRLGRRLSDGLTARQHEVAVLVAAGLTNRELAGRLHITERSAESHVERIRLRLGLRSRAQLAAWYAAQHDAGRDTPGT